jgi:hypothetical protein
MPGKATGAAPRLQGYKARYCADVVAFMAKGYSLTAFAGEIGETRTNLMKWCARHPNFAEAVERAQARRAACWRTRCSPPRVPAPYGLLDPMDLVTLTSGRLDRVLVRLTQVKENDDGSIACSAEEMLVGTAHAALYTRQGAGGYVSNFAADPGSVSAPVFVNPPTGYVAANVASLAASTGGVTTTSAAYQLWIAVAGTGANWGGCQVWASFDGVSYQMMGEVEGPARYGVSTADYPAAADPDTTDTLHVDLSASLGELETATEADADGGATLSVIGGEMIAWRDATLTAANQYALGGYVRRGLYGTPIADHPAGAEFVRIDAGVFRYGYDALTADKTLYLKFPSFNLYGQGLQGLEDAAAYETTLSPNTTTSAIEVQAQGIVGQGALATLDTADTAQIASYAVTNSITSEDATSVALGAIDGPPVQVGEITYEATGAPIRVDILVEIANTDGDHDENYTFTVYRDGTLLKTYYGWTRQNSAGVAGGWRGQTLTFFFDAGAVAGTHTWTVFAQATAGAGNASTKDLCRICLLELKDQPAS